MADDGSLHRLRPLAEEVPERSPASLQARQREVHSVSLLQRLRHLQGMGRCMLHERIAQ